MSKFPYLPPVLQWIPHVLGPEHVGLVVANAHHASAVEVDVLDFLRATSLVYSLLRLATEDVEGLSVGQQLRVDEVVNYLLVVLGLVVLRCHFLVSLWCVFAYLHYAVHDAIGARVPILRRLPILVERVRDDYLLVHVRVVECVHVVQCRNLRGVREVVLDDAIATREHLALDFRQASRELDSLHGRAILERLLIDLRDRIRQPDALERTALIEHQLVYVCNRMWERDELKRVAAIRRP